MPFTGRRKNLVKEFAVFIIAGIFAASCIERAPRTPVSITASDTPDAVAVRASDRTFKAFSHEIPEHKEFACNSCHRRETGTPDLKFAGHDSCVGCHISQFTNPEQHTMCTICHDDMKVAPPTMQDFPCPVVPQSRRCRRHAW